MADKPLRAYDGFSRVSELAPRAALLLGQLTGRRGPAPGVLAERRGSERRRDSSWSFLYGGLRPRRRTSRRCGDQHRILLDWHEPRILYIALAILLMSCLDALFTLNLLAVGGEELNAVMRVLLDRGITWFLLAKIGLTGFGIIALVIGARRLLLGRVPVHWVLTLFCAGYLVLIGWEVYLLGWQATSAGSSAIGEIAGWMAS